MTRFLHHLSAFAFYLLGASFFLAYIFLRNNFYPMESALWMQVADVPFIAVAVLYGGMSLYLSVKGSGSRVLPWLIGIPLLAIFGVLVVFNFWNV